MQTNKRVTNTNTIQILILILLGIVPEIRDLKACAKLNKCSNALGYE